MRLRTVAKDGALAALADSKSGVAAAKRDVELEAARAAPRRHPTGTADRVSSKTLLRSSEVVPVSVEVEVAVPA